MQICLSVCVCLFVCLSPRLQWLPLRVSQMFLPPWKTHVKSRASWPSSGYHQGCPVYFVPWEKLASMKFKLAAGSYLWCPWMRQSPLLVTIHTAWRVVFKHSAVALLWQDYPSVCPSVCLSVRLSVCPSVRPSVCPSVRLSVRPSVCTSVHHAILWSIKMWR